MDYESYYYHSSRHMTTPRSTNGNIKGIELEIDDFDAGYILDDMVEEDIITVPYNEDKEKEFVVCCEEDSSVFRELIFKACNNNTLLKGIKKISDSLHGNICNGHGTSCHIHLNNMYLHDNGIRREDIIKTTEFLAPILFKISGRNEDSMRWAKSIIRRRIGIKDDDLLKRARIIDSIDESGIFYHDRYHLVNTERSSTTEIRIFSNYYNFDYNYIKMYIETTDFIMELAKKMKNKSFFEEYDNIIEDCKEFFNKRKYKDITQKHNINRFFLSGKERKISMYNEEIQYIKNAFTNFKRNYENQIEEERAIGMLRLLRNFSNEYNELNIKINLKAFDENQIEEEMISILENKIAQLENE